MKEFLYTGTDLCKRVSGLEKFNEHSIGTIFEGMEICWLHFLLSALVCACFNENGMAVTESVVLKYCNWVDKNMTFPDAEEQYWFEVQVTKNAAGNFFTRFKRNTYRIHNLGLDLMMKKAAR